MKVKELIAWLYKFPQDAEVTFYNDYFKHTKYGEDDAYVEEEYSIDYLDPKHRNVRLLGTRIL